MIAPRLISNSELILHGLFIFRLIPGHVPQLIVVLLQDLVLLDRVREVLMQLLPIRVEYDDLLVPLLAQRLPLDYLLVLLHHRLLTHPVLLGHQPVLIGDGLYDSLEPALIVDPLVLARAREGVDPCLQVLYLRLEDLVLRRQALVLLHLVSLEVQGLDVLLDVPEIPDPLLRLGQLRFDLLKLGLRALQVLLKRGVL